MAKATGKTSAKFRGVGMEDIVNKILYFMERFILKQNSYTQSKY
jgi:hypothetical protein